MRTVKKHDERKLEIIETGAKLFSTKGYRNTTVNDILKEVGIAKGTFYHYFQSKEEVMDAVVDNILSTIIYESQLVVNDNRLSALEKFFLVVTGTGLQKDPGVSPKNSNHLQEQSDLLTERYIQQHSDGYNKKQENTNETITNPYEGNPVVTEYLKKMYDSQHRAGSSSEFMEELTHPDNAEMHQKILVATIQRVSPLLTEIITQGIEEHSFSTPHPQEIIEYLLVSSSFMLNTRLFGFNREELKRRVDVYVYMAEELLGVEKGTLRYIGSNARL